MNLSRLLPFASALVLLLAAPPARAQDPEDVVGHGKDGREVRRKDLAPFADFGEVVFKKGTVFGVVNLSHANFTKAKLVGVDLSEATLLGANFAGASLVGSKVPAYALDGKLVILKDTLGPMAVLLNPAPKAPARPHAAAPHHEGQTSKRSRCGSSMASLTRTKKVTASRPSMIRWS